MASISNTTDRANLEGDSPSLSLSNNSNEFTSNNLSTAQKKSAISLANNVQYMAEKYGLENLGFLTLTFPFKVTNMKNAQKLFNNMATAYLREKFPNYIAVKERDKSGKIHFHLIVQAQQDIRTGFDFDAIKNRDYSSANPYLKSLWSSLRKELPKYKFGRSELLPIKSSAEGIARYVGSYIKKGVQRRSEKDRGTRLVNYGGDSRNTNTRFSSVSEGAYQWRKKVALFAQMMGDSQGIINLNHRNIHIHLGKNWAYKYREIILNLPEQPWQRLRSITLYRNI